MTSTTFSGMSSSGRTRIKVPARFACCWSTYAKTARDVKDVRIIPHYGINVLSENTFLNKGSSVVKEPDPITRRIYARVVSGDGVLQLRCERHHCGLFLLYATTSCRYGATGCTYNASLCTFHLPNIRPVIFENQLSVCWENTSESNLLLLWHLRFGHRYFRDVANHLRGLGVNFKTLATTNQITTTRILFRAADLLHYTALEGAIPKCSTSPSTTMWTPTDYMLAKHCRHSSSATDDQHAAPELAAAA